MVLRNRDIQLSMQLHQSQKIVLNLFILLADMFKLVPDLIQKVAHINYFALREKRKAFRDVQHDVWRLLLLVLDERRDNLARKLLVFSHI